MTLDVSKSIRSHILGLVLSEICSSRYTLLFDPLSFENLKYLAERLKLFYDFSDVEMDLSSVRTESSGILVIFIAALIVLSRSLLPAPLIVYPSV